MSNSSRLVQTLKKIFWNKFVKGFLIFSVVLGASAPMFYSCAVNKADKAFLKNIENAPYDVVIVPGFPYKDEDSTWHDVMKMRVYWSKYLYDHNYTKNIIYSGSAVYSPYIESEVMKLFGEEIGIPDSIIYTETRAEHSTENLYYSYNMAKELGFEKIALATDPFQMAMLTSFAKRENINVDYLPVVIDTLKTITKVNPDIDVSQTRKSGFVPITERESKWKRWMGTLGYNIKRKPHEKKQPEVKYETN